MLKRRRSCLRANFLLMHRGNPLSETQGFSALARCCLPDTGDSRTGSTRGSCEITVAGVHCEGITVFPRLTRVVLGWLLEARVFHYPLSLWRFFCVPTLRQSNAELSPRRHHVFPETRSPCRPRRRLCSPSNVE